jgi:signal transduction histidine kinase
VYNICSTGSKDYTASGGGRATSGRLRLDFECGCDRAAKVPSDLTSDTLGWWSFVVRVANRESLAAPGNNAAATRILSVSDLARSAKSRIASRAPISLSWKFCAAASVAIACGMVLIGGWAKARIEAGIADNFAAAAALYIDSFINPHLQELASTSSLSEEHKRALDALLSSRAMRKPIVAFRIWKGNTVVYSDRREDIGRTLPPTAALARAWNGQIAGQLDRLTDAHSPGTPSSGLPVLELYAPVRQQGSDRIIAVAEIYEIAPALKEELSRVQFQSGLLVGAVTLVIVALFFGIVDNGSRTIARQRIRLEHRIAELSRLLVENNELRKRVKQANERVVENNERYLRRIGADLHDGPLQLLGLALLRLDELRDGATTVESKIPGNADQIGMIGGIVTEAMQDIHRISAGLGPPDIDDVSLREALQIAAQKHELRTGTEVRCELGELDGYVAFPLKACLFRFVQEGLNNAYQHANGRGQAVLASRDGAKVEVKVVDEGPGLAGSAETENGGGQGLSGLRDRIESLGGTFEIYSTAGKGTWLTARFDTLPAEARA